MNSSTTVTMAIDTKKNGIRIHKMLFRQLGQPKYILLLVNPENRVVAIKSSDLDFAGGQTHRIIEKRMNSENSYEIYSLPFIKKLREVEPEIMDKGAYRLTGSVISPLNMAVFPLNSLQRTDR